MSCEFILHGIVNKTTCVVLVFARERKLKIHLLNQKAGTSIPRLARGEGRTDFGFGVVGLFGVSGDVK